MCPFQVPDVAPLTPESKYRQEIIQESQLLFQRMKDLFGSSQKPLVGSVGDITYSLDCYGDQMCQFEFSYNPDRTEDAFIQIRPGSIECFFPAKDSESRGFSFRTDRDDRLLPLEGDINVALMNIGVVLFQIEEQKRTGTESTITETAHRVDDTLAP